MHQFRCPVRRVSLRSTHSRQFKERTRFVLAQFIASRTFKEKRRNELREDERRYSRPLRYLRC